MYFRDRHPYIFNEGTDLISLCSRERDKKNIKKTIRRTLIALLLACLEYIIIV